MPHSHAAPLRFVRNWNHALFATVIAAFFVVGNAYGDGPQFESPPVHPIELSADGSTLFALHQADHRLIVFDLSSELLPVRAAEIFVGLEPVSVRARTATEVWVVNHLSDSISIVDLTTGVVTATLRVGDEPTDVVFAGTPERAFVVVSQEDLIRVYNPLQLEQAPVEIPLLQSDPIALAVSPDGQSVYVAAMDSGNQTTVVSRQDVELGGGPPPPNPPMAADLPPAPRTALIVAHDTTWRDETGRDWSDYIGYLLADQDVIRIDAQTLSIVEAYSGVGTTLLGLAVNPVTGQLYVSNQEAHNQIRFEPNLTAQFLKNRVTVIDPVSGQVSPLHLNAHINYDAPLGTEQERDLSLSIPTALTVSSDGSDVYVAAFGSAKVGILNADGVLSHRIEVGDGPCGLALDEDRHKLYVLRRVPGQLTVVDLADDSRDDLSLGFDPTPEIIHSGRRRFYDGQASSAHGDLSCASCHVFGGADQIAWDLGDPQGAFIEGISGAHAGYHPMKGPLMTQSLKGLTDTDPYHWRGDRPSLIDFNPAFVSLLGMADPLSPGAFAELESYFLSLTYPPNPFRNLDGSLPNPGSGPNPTLGKELFMTGGLSDSSVDCIECHEFPTGEKALVVPAIILGEDVDQDFVVPHLRNLYEKTRFNRKAEVNVRGFGVTHDGSTDGLFNFFGERDFTFESSEQKDHVVSFLMAFDTGTHSSVGAQFTMNEDNSIKGRPRIEMWMDVSEFGPLGLIAKGPDSSDDLRGWTCEGGSWTPDRSAESSLSLDELLTLVESGNNLTFTAVYPGTELRLGIDRDLDGFLDRDELDAGSDPGDPSSTPDAAAAPEILLRTGIQLDPIWPNPSVRAARMAFRIPRDSVASVEVYDIRGRRVRELMDGAEVGAGRHELTWDLSSDSGRRVGAGLYFARLKVGDTIRTQRVVVR